MRSKAKFIAVLQAALMLSGIGYAQTNKPAGNESQTASSSQANEQQQNEIPHTSAVFWVSSVEVMRSAHEPQLDVVRVRGLTSTEGWESVQLVPLTKGTPADGFLDLVLVGEAPADSTVPSPYVSVEAVFTIEPGHPFKGVRVHGAENRITVKSLPGYAEAPTHPRDCSNCVGKYLVRKGENDSAGRSQTAIVREEELPHNLRVIHEAGGVGSIDSDPNRMTLLLDADGQIVEAMWD